MSSEELTIHVSTKEELLSALDQAEGGETIVLAPGDYGALDISPRTLKQSLGVYDSEVTITSADPLNPAVFSELDILGGQNITFDSVDFEFTPGEGDTTVTDLVSVRPWTLDDRPSSNITFQNTVFEGFPVSEEHGGDPEDHLDVKAHGGNVEGLPTGIALRVTGSNGVTLIDSEITGFHRAAVFERSDDLVVKDNYIHDLRSDGINFAATQNVLIEGNEIRDMTPWRHDEAPGKGDHGDLIQFWTANTTTQTSDVVIRGNFLHVSEGDASQSIFMRNEAVDRGQAGEELYYNNILIEDNVVYNAHTHGTTIGEGNNITIRHNTYIQNVEKGSSASVTVPAIKVASQSTNVTIEDNIVPEIRNQDMDGSNGWSIRNNLITQNTDPNGENYVGDLFIDALSGSHSSRADLQAIPDGLIESLGVGSSLTQFNLFPDTLEALFISTSEADAGDDNKFTFDARLTANSDGLVGDTATYHWDFGDGTTATGPVVEHEFSKFGDFQVRLTVTTPDGEVSTNTAVAHVNDPLLLSLDLSENSADDMSSYQTEVDVGADAIVKTADGSYAYNLGANQTLSIDRGADQLYNHDQLSFDFDLQRADISEGGGYIFNWHSSLSLKLTDQGQFVFEFINAEDETFTLTSDVPITDTDWHRVVLTYDAHSGFAILYVDGEKVGHAAMEGLTSAKEYWGLELGKATSANFDGLVRDFTVYGGVLDPEGYGVPIETSLPVEQDSVTSPILDVSKVLKPAPVLEPEPEPAPVPVLDADEAQLLSARDAAYAGIEEGTLANADTLIGSSADDIIFSGDGNDSLRGAGGDDFLAGEEGNDRLFGGAGFDTVYGGAGDDRAAGNRVFGEEGNDVLKSDKGQGEAANYLDGGSGNDTLVGRSGADHLIGGDGNDVLRGGGGDDTLEGGDGDDHITGSIALGGAGNDTIIGNPDGEDGLTQTLSGGSGNDVIRGRDGDEILSGDAGTDTLKGGNGDDTLRADYDDSYLHGGKGHDWLEIEAGGDTFDFSDRFLIGLEEISFANGNQDTIVLNSLSDIRQADEDVLVLHGDSGDQLELGIDLEVQSTVTNDFGVFTVLSNGQQTLWVDNDILF